MVEIDKNPATKRKFLEKLLNEHRHIMTSNQVQRITYILDNLPPSETLYSTSTGINKPTKGSIINAKDHDDINRFKRF